MRIAKISLYCILNSDYNLHPDCFRKFRYAKSLDKRKCKDGDAIKSKIQRTARSSQSIEAADKRRIFLNICMIFKKKNIRGRYYYATRILTRNAEETFKKAAQLKNDEGMLLEIHEVDLIAKEFKKHDKCRRASTIFRGQGSKL